MVRRKSQMWFQGHWKHNKWDLCQSTLQLKTHIYSDRNRVSQIALLPSCLILSSTGTHQVEPSVCVCARACLWGGVFRVKVLFSLIWRIMLRLQSAHMRAQAGVCVSVSMSQYVYFGVCPPFVDSFVCMRVNNHATCAFVRLRARFGAVSEPPLARLLLQRSWKIGGDRWMDEIFSCRVF